MPGSCAVAYLDVSSTLSCTLTTGLCDQHYSMYHFTQWAFFNGASQKKTRRKHFFHYSPMTAMSIKKS